jgi:hypothetical protein
MITLPRTKLYQSIKEPRRGGHCDIFLEVTNGVSGLKNGLIKGIFYALHDAIKIKSRQNPSFFFLFLFLLFWNSGSALNQQILGAIGAPVPCSKNDITTLLVDWLTADFFCYVKTQKKHFLKIKKWGGLHILGKWLFISERKGNIHWNVRVA